MQGIYLGNIIILHSENRFRFNVQHSLRAELRLDSAPSAVNVHKFQ